MGALAALRDAGRVGQGEKGCGEGCVVRGERYSKLPYPHTFHIPHMSIERRNETHINQNGRTAGQRTRHSSGRSSLP